MLLTGPAVRVAEGVVDPSWLEAVPVRIAKRVESLPPYLFAELDRKLEAKRAEGVDVISLGVGDPDLPTPEHIVEAMREAVLDPSTHRYPSYYGSPSSAGRSRAGTTVGSASSSTRRPRSWR